MRFDDPISQREACNLLKCSKGQIYKLIQAKKLVQDDYGKLSKKDVLKFAVLSEIEVPTLKETPKAQSKKSKHQTNTSDFDDEQLKQLSKEQLLTLVTEDPIQALNTATALERIFKQEKQRIELEKTQGKLMDVNVVAKAFSDIAIKTRQRLMALPPRLAGRLEGRDAREIEEILETELVEALTSLEYDPTE